MIVSMKTLCGNCRAFSPAEIQELPLGAKPLQHGSCKISEIIELATDERPDAAPEDWPLVTTYEKCNAFQPNNEAKYV